MAAGAVRRWIGVLAGLCAAPAAMAAQPADGGIPPAGALPPPVAATQQSLAPSLVTDQGPDAGHDYQQMMDAMNRGDAAGAEKMLRATLAKELGRRPVNQAIVANAEVNLGIVLKHEGRDPEAETLFRSAVDRAGQRSSNYAALSNLAMTLDGQKEYAQAEIFIRRAVSGASTGFGKGGEDSMKTQLQLIQILLDAGRKEAAEKAIAALDAQIHRYNYVGTFYETRLSTLKGRLTEDGAPAAAAP